MYSYFLPKEYPKKGNKGQQQPAEPGNFAQRGINSQATQPPPNGITYAWKLTGFTQCTHSCAGGTFNNALNPVVKTIAPFKKL